MPNDNILASVILALTFFAPPVKAVATDSAEAAIRAALSKWTQDFNAGKADAVCSLFARDLRYDFRGYPERDYDDICTRLRRSLADWLTDMELVPAMPQGGIDRYIGYYEPYATSHDALDRDTAVQREVRNAAKALVEGVALARAGRLPHVETASDPRPK